jgi:hypothetical protein
LGGDYQFTHSAGAQMSKSKMRHEEDVFWGHDGTYIDLEATQELRDRKPLPDNRPPGPKWQAKQGMARLPLNGAEYAVLACLIDRASKSKGACYPSQEFISAWTFRPLRTVERAIAALNDKGVIQSIPRGTTSNAYIINWPILFSAYRQMKALERSRERHGNVPPKVAGHAAKSGGSYPSKVAAEPMNRTYEEEPMTLRGPSDDEPPYLVILDEKKKEEAFKEVGEDPRGQAYDRLIQCCTPFHWEHLTEEQFDSAVDAEMAEVGSGRAVLDAEANATWHSSRKGRDK